jgi:hypothetical protein
MAGVAGVHQLGPCARVRLPSPGRRRTDLFHGPLRKTHGGGALGRLLFVTAEPHSLGGGGGKHRGRWTGTWPRGLLLAEPPPKVASHTCDGDEAATETRKAEAGEGNRRRKAGRSVLKRFGCANDTMINKHSSPMKGRGQVCSNEEQFAFPLLICNEILYRVFLRQP